jgi:hypothetical protein
MRYPTPVLSRCAWLFISSGVLPVIGSFNQMVRNRFSSESLQRNGSKPAQTPHETKSTMGVPSFSP